MYHTVLALFTFRRKCAHAERYFYYYYVNKKASKSCINDTQQHMINVQCFLFDKGIHWRWNQSFVGLRNIHNLYMYYFQKQKELLNQTVKTKGTRNEAVVNRLPLNIHKKLHKNHKTSKYCAHHPSIDTKALWNIFAKAGTYQLALCHRWCQSRIKPSDWCL